MKKLSTEKAVAEVAAGNATQSPTVSADTLTMNDSWLDSIDDDDLPRDKIPFISIGSDKSNSVLEKHAGVGSVVLDGTIELVKIDEDIPFVVIGGYGPLQKGEKNAILPSPTMCYMPKGAYGADVEEFSSKDELEAKGYTLGDWKQGIKPTAVRVLRMEVLLKDTHRTNSSVFNLEHDGENWVRAKLHLNTLSAWTNGSSVIVNHMKKRLRPEGLHVSSNMWNLKGIKCVGSFGPYYAPKMTLGEATSPEFAQWAREQL